MGYGKCPRCGCLSFEHLKTHSHCWECNYTPDDEVVHLQFIESEDNESRKRFKFESDEDDETVEEQDDDSEIEAV